VLCFCNDGLERICKIRGALCRGPKKQIIEVGDIVLIGMRDFEVAGSSDDDAVFESTAARKKTSGGADGVGLTSATGRREIADIMSKYKRSDWRHIRKEGGIHKHLFVSETGHAHEGADDELLFEEDAADTIQHVAATVSSVEPDNDTPIDIDAI
jgi:hypothetical protein